MVTFPELAASQRPAADLAARAKADDHAAFDYSVRLWLATGGPIVSQSALSMGPLLSALSRHVRTFLMEERTPRVEARSVAWLMNAEDPSIPLEPHTDPGRV